MLAPRDDPYQVRHIYVRPETPIASCEVDEKACVGARGAVVGIDYLNMDSVAGAEV